MSGPAQQFAGVQGSKPLDTNPVGKTVKANRQQAGMPVDEQLRIDYGVIAKVDSGTSRVKIDITNRSGKPVRIGTGEAGTGEGIWVPILQPLEVIHNTFGSLRKGLLVRVFWRGKNAPGAEAVAEVFSNVTMEEFKTGSQEARSNEIATGPHDIFTGGVNF